MSGATEVVSEVSTQCVPRVQTFLGSGLFRTSTMTIIKGLVLGIPLAVAPR
jgi:hypothetical protein